MRCVLFESPLCSLYFYNCCGELHLSCTFYCFNFFNFGFRLEINYGSILATLVITLTPVPMRPLCIPLLHKDLTRPALWLDLRPSLDMHYHYWLAPHDVSFRSLSICSNFCLSVYGPQARIIMHIFYLHGILSPFHPCYYTNRFHLCTSSFPHTWCILILVCILFIYQIFFFI